MLSQGVPFGNDKNTRTDHIARQQHKRRVAALVEVVIKPIKPQKHPHVRQRDYPDQLPQRGRA